MIRRTAVLALALAASSGCSVVSAWLQGRPITAHDVVSDVIDTIQDIADLGEILHEMPYEEEAVLGQSTAARLIAMYGLSEDRKAQRYVNLVGAVVVRNCSRPGIPYHFAVIRSEKPNAYSCPGGYILITEGLLRIMEDEAELAFILAHEVVHAARKHVAESIRSRKKKAFWSNKVGRLTKLSAAKFNVRNSQSLFLFTDLIAQGLLEHAFTQEQEDESDKVALELMSGVGYDIRASYELLARMHARGRGSAAEERHEHKSALERRSYLQKHAREQEIALGSVRNPERFRKRLKNYVR